MRIKPANFKNTPATDWLICPESVLSPEWNDSGEKHSVVCHPGAEGVQRVDTEQDSYLQFTLVATRAVQQDSAVKVEACGGGGLATIKRELKNFWRSGGENLGVAVHHC